MTFRFDANQWAVILGASSGFGLASAHRLAAHGMNLFVIHRDRRGAMARIDTEFAELRGHGVRVVTYNRDALSPEHRHAILDDIAEVLGESGRVRTLLHSIAFGNLKLIVPEAPREHGQSALYELAGALGVDARQLRLSVDSLFESGADALQGLASAPAYGSEAFLEDEDMERTVFAMGTSLLSWTQGLFSRGCFAADARVLGMTSEGNSVAWKGYAAVAAAKAALESVSRAIATELGPHGVRSNVIQAGVTDTPALRLIPGNARLKAQARMRNPMGRLTQPQDVAAVVYLLSLPESAWINGDVIRVDGGEHISGVVG